MADMNTIAEELKNNSEEVIEETVKQTASFAERHPNLHLLKVGGLIGAGAAAAAGAVYGAIELGGRAVRKVRDYFDKRKEKKAEAEVLKETTDE